MTPQSRDLPRSLFDDRTARDAVRRLGDLTTDRRPRWGRMSAGAMLCHLGDYFDVILGVRTARPAAPRVVQPFVRFALLHWIGAYPRNLPTLPEFLITVPTEFESDRQRLITAIQTFAARRDQAEWPPSPLAGTLKGEQWARLAHDHVAHHLRQFDL